MKKIFAASLTLATLLAFTACMKIFSPPDKPAPSESSSVPQSEASSSSAPELPPEPSSSTPESAAEKIMQQISGIDTSEIKALADEYFAGREIPEEYYSLLEPISERVSYEIGECTIDGDKAAVKVSVTAVDAQSAINSVMPGAATHLIIMQMTGKDVSNPEKILAEYAADNIKWDELPTIKTDTTLYLVKGADDEWKVDASNPDNLDFLNAVSGGGVEVAKSFQSLVERVAK